MSDRLLHERLRDAGGNCANTVKAVGLNCRSMKNCAECYDMLRKALADEIERQYVPAPHFPDGEPVREGSKVEGGTVGSWSVLDDRSWLIYDNLGRIVQSGGISDFAKRPEPDSLERLRDDIAEWRADVAIPGNGWDIKTAEWCDRLTALMERGA